MKLRHVIILSSIVLLLAACNFTLAQDVTPPPDYVPPTPAATLGPLFPANTPDIKNGEAIYAEKCLPCHGATGLGDGPQGKDLPVSVAALGLPDIAKKAKPSSWYMTVTQGNLNNFMPPFSSLNDQERWDVVSYALTLHTKPEQIAQGKSLFETSCADCTKTFSNSEMMSALSENDLIKIMKEGQTGVPAFGKNFTDEEASAVAAYMRSLTFASASAPVAVAATQTPVSAETTTPSADGTQAAVTPEAGTPQATVDAAVTATTQATLAAGFGKVSGSLDNKTGSPLPSNIKITLRAMAHGADPSTGPAEISSQETTANADGTFVFDNVEMPTNRIFIAEAEVNGQAYKSEFAVVKDGMTELVVPAIPIFASSDDFTVLSIDSLQIYFDFAKDPDIQIFGVYTITNPTDKGVAVKMGDKQEIPFIAFPEGTTALGYEATQDTAAFVQTADGFAMPPSKTPYGLIAFASIPKADKLTIKQRVLLPIGGASIYLPEGMNAEGKNLSDEGVQTIQNTVYHLYTTAALKKDETLEFTVTGKPKDTTAANANIMQNKTLLIGVGAFGLVLILAGVWLFMRDRKREVVVEDEEGEEFDDPESLMDAIIALDDLHRAGKLSDEAYQKRREELKNALKRKS
jgi:mono/diheme cytochrome c family protein